MEGALREDSPVLWSQTARTERGFEKSRGQILAIVVGIGVESCSSVLCPKVALRLAQRRTDNEAGSQAACSSRSSSNNVHDTLKGGAGE